MRLFRYFSAAHEPPVEEPVKFHTAMAELVRPIATR
jgi:hypothetical protein